MSTATSIPNRDASPSDENSAIGSLSTGIDPRRRWPENEYQSRAIRAASFGDRSDRSSAVGRYRQASVSATADSYAWPFSSVTYGNQYGNSTAHVPGRCRMLNGSQIHPTPAGD